MGCTNLTSVDVSLAEQAANGNETFNAFKDSISIVYRSARDGEGLNGSSAFGFRIRVFLGDEGEMKSYWKIWLQYLMLCCKRLH